MANLNIGNVSVQLLKVQMSKREWNNQTVLHDGRPFHDECSRQCLGFASQTSNVLLLMISRRTQLLELINVDVAREEID